MDHSQYDEELGDSEYLMPLSGVSPPRAANVYTRPERRTRFDEEQSSTMGPPQLQQRSARAPTNYPVSMPPVNYNENRSRQPARNAQAIAFARTESSDTSNRETQRNRLMFDGSIQNIPPSSGLSLSQRSNESQLDYNGGGNSSPDGEIQQLVIWNITLPLSLSR
jgi:hypothetical protein